MTAEGDASTVEVDATLAIYAEPDVGLDPDSYAIVLSVDAETYGTISPEDELYSWHFVDGKYVTTLTGVSAGDIDITAELKTVSYVDGVRTLTSFDTPITDTITITVETGGE